jgi:hypothetical protein
MMKGNKMTSIAVIHVKTVRTKTSDRIIGYRLEAAVPNQQGRVMKHFGDGDFYATEEVAPSFRKPYLIAESSDFNSINKQRLVKFMQDLSWSGFSQFELYGKYDGEPLSNLAECI